MEMEKSNINHLIWDWNGTLLDDAWLCIDILNYLLTEQQLAPITSETYQLVFDFPVKNYYEKLGFDFSSQPFEIIARKFAKIYNQRRFECLLQPGVRQVLAVLKSNGVQQHILSSYSQYSLEESVKHYSLSPFFNYLRGIENELAGGKLDLGYKMLQELELSSSTSEVILVGDTTHDFNVACSLGLRCCLFPSGHQSRNRLESCGIPLLDSLIDIVNFISNIENI